LQKRSDQSGKALYSPLTQSKPNQTFVAEKDSLRVAFLQGADGVMLLRIASGYGRLLNYSAVVTQPGRAAAPTPVCSVVARQTSVETWPPPLLAIELSDFQLQPEGATAVCR
jgi:hypothetical protein